jgi:hypothetical protein
MRPSAAALAVALFAAAPADADVRLALRPELRLSAGYDNNLFLDANPSGALPSQIRADAIFDIEPRASAWLNLGRHTLSLQLDYLERLTVSTGDLRDFDGRLEYVTPPLGPVSLFIAGGYEHYAASQYPTDTFELGAGEAGARLRLGERVRLRAQYRFAARSYDNRPPAGQLDLEQRAALVVTLRLADWLSSELGYHYLHLGSSEQTAQLDRHRGELMLAAWPTPWLFLSASYGLGAQHLPTGLLPSPPGTTLTGPRDDWLQTVSALVSARPRPWLELYARYDLLLSTSSAATGDYRRDQVTGGVIVRLDWERTWTRPPPLAPTVRGRLVTFRLRAPAGSRVAVLGDWSGWAAQPLAPLGAGRYEASYELPPGRHRYSFSVDGASVEPPEAPAYLPDDFGGRSGVVDVP